MTKVINKKNSLKSILLSLITVLLFSLVAPGLVQAENTPTNQNTDDMSTYSMPGLEEQLNPDDISTNSIPSLAVKESLKWAVKNTTTITNLVGKTFGKDAAKKVGNYMHSHVKPVLVRLEKLDDLTYGRVETELAEALSGPLGAFGNTAADFIMRIIRTVGP